MQPPTIPQGNRVLPAPIRILRQLLFRLRGGGNCIEYDVIERQLGREELAVKHAAEESRAIEKRLLRVRASVRTALTDEKTPGVIDQEESLAIARQLVGTSVAAHRHTQSLEALT